MSLTRSTLRKVPQITALFWILKVLTTAMGEATSDFSVRQIDPYLAVGLGAVAFVLAMILQLSVPRYIAWVYWLAVVMVAVFGTMVADALHIQLGIPYAVTTVGFAIALTVVFAVWYATERTLSIHHITTMRRELFYWATVCATFALGTATGDLTAYTLHLGFLASGILFAVVIAVPALAHRFARLDAVVAFWFAYIVTRPLGASFADWMGVPHDLSGLNWGRGTVAVSLTIIIACLVGYLTVTRMDVEDERGRQRVSPTMLAG
ncbi:MAG: hypothetical protein ACLQT7_00945 [Candidatus Dormibacteria bacterium]